MTKQHKVLYVILFLFAALLCSCENQKLISRFSEGDCFKRVYRKVASYSKSESVPYKVKEIKGREQTVYAFYNKSWYFSAKKRIGAHQDSEAFKFVRINCPDGSSNKSIMDRVNDIDIDA